VDSLPTIAFSALSAWVLLYLPGRALVRPGAVSLPAAFARVVASAVVTTLVATGLTAAEAFSLRNLLVADAAAAVVLFLLRRGLAPVSDGPRPARDFLGAAIVAAALGAYLPAWPVFLSGSDATAYLGSGISLARHGTLAREDLLGPALPPDVRSTLFDSMSQIVLWPSPPYRRVPGAMLVESLDAREAWPFFFPVPSVWSAISAVRGGSLDEQRAPDFSPLFAALALWAFWQLGRRWLGAPWAVFAVVLLGASGPWYTAAHMPMSEPIAAFFVLAGLAFTAAAASSGRRADALLAGASLGAAVFTRVEIAMLLVLAFALMPLFAQRAHPEQPAQREHGAWPPLPRVFFPALVAVASLTIVQALLLPGTYVSPLVDHLNSVRFTWHVRFGPPSWTLLAAMATAALAAFGLLVRLFGLSATVRWGTILGALLGHAAASRFLYERTPMWLSLYMGWSGLALFAAGAVLAWRARASLPAAPFVLALAAAASLILFYNPHVYPSLPWGSRRFVPILLPMLVLLATFTAHWATSKNRLLAVVFVPLLAWPVVTGGRPSWAEPMVAGAWDQVNDVAKAIPAPGVVLFDRELSRLMIAPTMWLVFDRNNVMIPPIDEPVGAEMAQKIARQFHGKWPVYYVTRAAGGLRRPPYTSLVPVGKTVLRLRFLESTYSSLPDRMVNEIVPLRVYRLGLSFDPKPGSVD
jgi:hypothetical protein